MNAFLWATTALCLIDLTSVFPLTSMVPQSQHTDTGDAQVDRLNNTLSIVARQLMLQQLYLEEKTRSEGDSGLKLTRLHRVGPRPYQAESHTSPTRVCVIFYNAKKLCSNKTQHTTSYSILGRKAGFSLVKREVSFSPSSPPNSPPFSWITS